MFELSTTNDPRQRLFDNAWNGLKSQGFERSVNDMETCVYRGVGGRKCALGWSISDDKYTPDMDSRDVENASARTDAVLAACGVSTDFDMCTFTAKLQRCHDNAYFHDEMKYRLRNFADRNGLVVPE